jgi:hypothetical protein
VARAELRSGPAAIAAIASIVACRDPQPADERTEGPPIEHALPTPRRPSARFTFERDASGCFVVGREGERVVHRSSDPRPCPRELAPGDRIRLAGRVCFVASEGRPEALTVCPGELVEVADAHAAARASGAPSSALP